ncbi:MAG: methyltransferase domain-containing protein [Gemmataceae bacterium]
MPISSGGSRDPTPEQERLAVTPSPTAQLFKTADAGSYDAVVVPFERFTDRFSQPLAERIVRLAEPAPLGRVLDVGCGTGVVALAVARTLTSPGHVLGVDMSEPMLRRAAAKAESGGLGDRTQFREMDAEALDLPRSTFDAVVSLFALMHFPHPEAALAEMGRVLRPGGRMVVGFGSGPALGSVSGVRRAFGRALDALCGWRGRYLSAPDYLNGLVRKYLPPSDAAEETDLAQSRRGRPKVVVRMVRTAGFRRVQTHWVGFQPSLDSPEEFWDLQRTYSSLARKRLAAARPEQVRALREEFFATCRRVLARGGRLAYPYGAFIVVAEKPGR